MAELQRVAVYPPDASAALLAALAAAGFDPVPVADAAALTDNGAAEGVRVLVVEVGAQPAAALSVARRARDQAGVAVLAVVARGQLPDVAQASVDDFVVAPLDPAELTARITRLSASASDEFEELISHKDLSLNLATYQATVGDHPIDLTYMEYELLRFFVTNPGRVWSREQLLSKVWGYDYFGGARTVDVHVRRLRAKLGEERASWITTVRSVGYRFG